MVFRGKISLCEVENGLFEDTNGKRRFKRMLNVLFVKKQMLSVTKFVSNPFEESDLVALVLS